MERRINAIVMTSVFELLPYYCGGTAGPVNVYYICQLPHFIISFTLLDLARGSNKFRAIKFSFLFLMSYRKFNKAHF